MSTLTTEPRATADSERDSALLRRPWITVTVREILVKVTDRSFVLSTLFTSLLLIGAVAVSAFFSARTTEHEVGTVATAEATVDDVLGSASQTIESAGDSVLITELESEQELRTAVVEGELDSALLQTSDGYVLLGGEEIDSDLQRAIDDAVRTVVLNENARAAGTTLAELEAGSTVTTELLATDADRGAAAYVAGFVFAFLFYMAALMYGMTIANSVLEEKQNRVVEILATAIPIRQILYGKVLGNSILAFGQIVLYGVVGLIAVNVADLAPDVGWILAASGWFIAFFALGFLALASVWAVLGSLASRTEDLQTNTGPIIMVIMAVLFVGLFATGTALQVASFVPVMSSVAMPVRMLSEDVPLWQPIVSLLLTGAAAWGMLRVGERIYQRAVMQGGTALTWRQAFRLES
ncbi:ABC transporter permease [Ruania alba]|uniref:ABC-2 type transport system permease protein n=1 Tax=Ruania alba TaxID=648782 RepID=A0A1H5G613_9MICO|nr:ABC transporter permease [Ruania alba]SEE11172.1 ABC-2 type transport system permease protein [Ruania alba]